jgi:hypothetical protein
MGSNDAGRSGGVDRATAQEMSEFQPIPESVTPEGLLARADLMRATDPSCARHLELAAEEIKKLRRQGPTNALEDPALGTRWEGRHNDRGSTIAIFREKEMLGYFYFNPEETYDFGMHFVYIYDKLEGL